VEKNRGPDMIPHSYAHLIRDEGAKDIWWRKRQLLQQMLWKVFFCLQNTETRFMFITLHYYQLKMDQGPLLS
jgi:hypothetical protein